MKTAMQELIDEIVEHLTYDDDLTYDNRTSLETIRLRCLIKLTKEKEQIINAHTNAYLIGEDDISVDDANEASIKYYNQTYDT